MYSSNPGRPCKRCVSRKIADLCHDRPSLPTGRPKKNPDAGGKNQSQSQSSQRHSSSSGAARREDEKADHQHQHIQNGGTSTTHNGINFASDTRSQASSSRHPIDAVTQQQQQQRHQQQGLATGSSNPNMDMLSALAARAAQDYVQPQQTMSWQTSLPSRGPLDDLQASQPTGAAATATAYGLGDVGGIGYGQDANSAFLHYQQQQQQQQPPPPSAQLPPSLQHPAQQQPAQQQQQQIPSQQQAADPHISPADNERRR
jgi:hypothetical protein